MNSFLPISPRQTLCNVVCDLFGALCNVELFLHLAQYFSAVPNPTAYYVFYPGLDCLDVLWLAYFVSKFLELLPSCFPAHSEAHSDLIPSHTFLILI